MVVFERGSEPLAELAETVRARMRWDWAAVRTVPVLAKGEWHRGQYQYSGVIEGQDTRSYQERIAIVKKRELGRAILRSLSK